MFISFFLQLTGNVDELLFLDLTYVVNINTLAEDAFLPCNDDMDFNYDDCLTRKVGESLADKYGCVVPYLPKPKLPKDVRCVLRKDNFKRISLTLLYCSNN